MIVELPEWRPFAPGTFPWIPDGSETGRVVVLLAPAAARRDGWATRTALDLVGEWSDAGRKVVLADGVLEYPMLHRELGLANTEGVSDAALFGASVARVARPVPGRSFFFVSAGSPTGHPLTVANSPRWRRLLDGFKDAGVVFVLFLREGCTAAEELARGADDLVVLAGSGEDVPDAARRLADRVRIVVGPAAGSTGVQPTDDASGQTLDEPTEGAVHEFADEALGADPLDDALEHEALDGPPPDGPGQFDARHDPFESIPSHASLSSTPDPAGVPEEVADEEWIAGASGRIDDAGRSLEETPVGGTAQEGVLDETLHVDPPTLGYAPARGGRRRSGADPDARKKLLWVGLVVLILIAIVILGALR